MEKKICLNGTWDFAPGALRDTAKEDWQSDAIKVPSPFNVNGFSGPQKMKIRGEETVSRGADMRLYPQYPLEWDKLKAGSYRRMFFVPDEKKRVFLRFDAVASISEFYVNGVCLKKEDEAFLPIEFEATDHVKFGQENELVVYCRDFSELRYTDTRGDIRFDVPQGSFWGMYAVGIWQDVWMILRDENYISDVFAVPDIDSHTLTVSVETDGGCDSDKIRLSLKEWNTEEAYQTIWEGAVGKAVWEYDPDRIKLWDIGRPNLYMLRTELLCGDRVADVKETRIGFRSFGVEGKRFRLNGRLINLRNDSWHYMGYSVQEPTYAKALYEMEREANVNIVRLHAEPWPEFFIDAADEAGMLISDESAIWASHCRFGYTDALFERGRIHMERLMKRDRNHPSVVFWSVENECIMALKAGNSPMVESVEVCEDKIWEYIQDCNKFDDSRIFSGDGSWDLRGRAAVCSLHYPTQEPPFETIRPFIIGEMSDMYSSTPDNNTGEAGESALLSTEGRQQALAEEAAQLLSYQRKWAAQTCVFNLMWYGLEPMAYAERQLPEGKEGEPGIHPQRITPYLRPINAGLDPAFPEYTPNPFWFGIRDAYEPIRFFLMEPPYSVYSNTDTVLPVRVYNDGETAESFTLRVAWKGGASDRCVELGAAECLDTELTVPAGDEGEKLLHITLELEDRIVYSMSFTLKVYDKQAILDELDSLNVPVITQGEAPEGVFIDLRKDTLQEIRHARQQYSVFAPDKVYFNGKLGYDSFVPPLPFNGKPLIYTGDGEPVVIHMNGKMVCGLPLTDETQPEMLAIRLALSKKLKEAQTAAEADIDIWGDAAEFCTLLDVLGVGYRQLTKEQLDRNLTDIQKNVLVTAGELPAQISRFNYKKVLVLDPDKAPLSLSDAFRRTDMKSFHLIRKDRDLGLYGNNLYGLTAGRQNILAKGMLVLENDELENLLGQPNIDWRRWFGGGEQVKTISVKRSVTDNSRLSALAEGCQAGSKIWFTTLSVENTPQLRHIWARLLDELGVVIPYKGEESVKILFTGSVYGNGTQKLLYYPGMKAADAKPGLNKWQDGGWWRSVSQGEKDPGCYALYLYSPQDRTDLLANPDTMNLFVEADCTAHCFLNGTDLGCGPLLSSVPLRSGWNLLLLETEKRGKVPVVYARRTNGLASDLICSLMDEVTRISLEGAVYSASYRTEEAALAAHGTGKYWTVGEYVTQTPDMWFQIELPKEEEISAICLGGRGLESRQNTNMPSMLDIYAGEDAEHLTCIAKNAPIIDMVYEDGAEQLKGFVAFEKQKAKCIRLQIAKVFLDRGWSIQNIEIFK